MKKYIEELEKIEAKKRRINIEEDEARQKLWRKEIGHEEHTTQQRKLEQKYYLLNIESALLKNDIKKKIIKTYNEQLRPYILKKYAKVDIGEKRKKEIENEFKRILEEKGVFANIGFSILCSSWSFARIYIRLYRNDQKRAECLDFYKFEFEIEKWQDGIKAREYYDIKETPIEDVEQIAKDILKKKIEAVQKIQEKEKEIKDILNKYNEETDERGHEEAFELVHINYKEAELKEDIVKGMATCFVNYL